ncbi:unnamed protein product [Enterobius vermicularis]|uniref:ORC_WH_C domain-containing protein n=1 Tax=Enterobius vermicularis TaxID=51028 RepID=A0A0N4VBT4_ENTVE|nr:unnamed protein product [Enterobius vermicularis]
MKLFKYDDSIDASVASSSRNFKFIYDDGLAECSERPVSKKIFFRAGCSGDSSDLINLVKLYQDSDDRETLKHWMDIYAQQRKNAQKGDSGCNASVSERNSDDFLESSNTASSGLKELQYKTIQSLDRLVPVEGTGGVGLEKCHSLDYRKETDTMDSKGGLRRCQEMSNISLLDS